MSAPASTHTRSRLAAFVSLTKPRIIELLLVTTVPTMVVAEGGIPSLWLIAATVIGGGGTLVGAVIGSLILVPLGELLRDFGSLRIAVYALILTVVIVYRTEGLIPFIARKYEQFERWVDV